MFQIIDEAEATETTAEDTEPAEENGLTSLNEKLNAILAADGMDARIRLKVSDILNLAKEAIFWKEDASFWKEFALRTQGQLEEALSLTRINAANSADRRQETIE